MELKASSKSKKKDTLLLFVQKNKKIWETVINFDNGSQTAGIYTASPQMMK